MESAVTRCHGVVVGDASGVDAEAQRYLLSLGARNVKVYCAKGGPRNNVGDWPVVEAVAKARPKTFEFFAAKDRAMAEAADAGLVVWDGKSRGTLLQCYRLAHKGKFVAVYSTSNADFTDVGSPEAWQKFVETLSEKTRAELDDQVARESGCGAPNLFEPAM